jgi:SAM-dependent methyltransferase
MASIYERLPPDFYDSSLRSLNPLTRQYHSGRYAKIRGFLATRYREGMEILDIGSGSANWNERKYPLIGLDQNRKMLEHGKAEGRISKAVVWDLSEIPLPLDAGFDFIIISEVLEHLAYPEKIIMESNRLLKKDGFIVVTVPLDTTLSPWRILFGLNCFLKGDILGDGYYKSRCGHVQHFSLESMTGLLERNGFSIVEKRVTLMNIGILAKKISQSDRP